MVSWTTLLRHNLPQVQQQWRIGYGARTEEPKASCFGDRNLDLEQTITLAKKGLKASELKKKAFEALSAGFARGDVVDLDERLAWIMSFRTVFNAPPPTLWLGSVVTEIVDGNEKHLICMRPRCDCVSLDKETSFFFSTAG